MTTFVLATANPDKAAEIQAVLTDAGAPITLRPRDPSLPEVEETGLTLEDFDLFELNEAFAPQVLAVLRDLPMPADRLNVNGGAIALGHPIGCTGARILVTLLHEMKRRNVKRGLATLCVSGGLGMAMAVERS